MGEKRADALWLWFMTRVHTSPVAPAQSPPKETLAGFPVASMVTTVLTGYVRVHVLGDGGAAQVRGGVGGEMDTTPETWTGPGATATVKLRVNVMASNRASTVVFELTVRMHGPLFPVQPPPLQVVNPEPGAAAALSCTCVPQA
jgi:hypothetical protein